jgi:hypothetical protein
MAKTLRFSQVVSLAQLNDELNALPELAPVGEGLARSARFSLLFDDSSVTVIVEDDVPEALIAKVVADHVPRPAGPAPDYGNDLQTAAELAAGAAQMVAELRGYVRAAVPTGAQTVAVVRLLCRVVLYLVARQLG